MFYQKKTKICFALFLNRPDCHTKVEVIFLLILFNDSIIILSCMLSEYNNPKHDHDALGH